MNKDSAAVHQVLGNERENYEQKTIFFDDMSAKKRAEGHMWFHRHTAKTAILEGRRERENKNSKFWNKGGQ